MKAFTNEINRDRQWLSTSEAAEYLKVSKSQLLNYVSEGKIPYYKLGRSNRYLKSELDKVLLNNKGRYYDDTSGK